MLFCSECLLVLMFFDSSSSSWLMSHWNRFVRKFVLRNDRKSLGCSGSGLGFLCLILVLFQKKLHWFVVMFSCLFCSVPLFFQLFSNLSDSMCFITFLFFFVKVVLPFSAFLSVSFSQKVFSPAFGTSPNSVCEELWNRQKKHSRGQRSCCVCLFCWLLVHVQTACSQSNQQGYLYKAVS